MSLVRYTSQWCHSSGTRVSDVTVCCLVVTIDKCLFVCFSLYFYAFIIPNGRIFWCRRYMLRFQGQSSYIHSSNFLHKFCDTLETKALHDLVVPRKIRKCG